MRKFLIHSLLVVALVCLVAGTSVAQPILNSAEFTLRSTSNAGPALAMDAVFGDGGFEGFLTNLEGFQVDRTYFEYDLSPITGPVASATLDFTLSGLSTDTIFLDSYTADGMASLSDWSALTAPVTSFMAAPAPFSIDITSTINSNIGLPYLGFVFSIDPHPAQAFFPLNGSGNPQINFTPVPEPSSIALLGLGILAVFAGTRRRLNR